MSYTSDYVATDPITPPVTPTRKLPTPYTARSRFVAQRHHPSATVCERAHERRKSSRTSLHDASQLDWCLSHPPNTGGALTSEYCIIEIERPLRTGDDCGAQILLLTNGLVAKIYDPLYYNFHYDYAWIQPKAPQKRNVTLIADSEYTAETAAYAELGKTGSVGIVAPAFHGSWVFDVEVLHVEGWTGFRQVQMILVEHVGGIGMLDIEPQDLTPVQRENIMAKVIEAETDLVVAGVRHGDFQPRNIILSRAASSLSRSSSDSCSSTDPALFADPDLRVCVVDFALCAILPSAEGGVASLQCRNPLFHWADREVWSDCGWLPPCKEAKDWMWRLWGDGGKEGKYVAVEKDSLDSSITVKEPGLEVGACEAPCAD